MSVLAVCGALWPLAASGSSDYNQDLRDVRTQVESLKIDEISSIEEQQKTKKMIESVNNDVADIVKKRRDAQTRLNRLQVLDKSLVKRKNLLLLELERQSTDLKSIIRGSIVVSKINFLKVVFSQDDSTKLMRTVNYYRYLTQARADQTRQIHQLVEEFETTESEIYESNVTVRSLVKEMNQQHGRLLDIKQSLNALIEERNSINHDSDATEDENADASNLTVPSG